MKAAYSDHWYRRSILYHIYPLSFADSNGDGFGDIPGIIQHLDYLNDGTSSSLGVGAIWLSPIYRSPMVDWGYDIVDHRSVDARFGTMKDFEELVRQVHARGMKLLLDFVPSHTSNLHEWFANSRSGFDSAKRDWYIWADPSRHGGPPNNWLSRFGGSAWTLDDQTGQYYLHSFLPEQPDLNWRNSEVRDAMIDVLNFWLEQGVDGFRTDAVYNLIKDKLLRDDLPNSNFRAGQSHPADQFLRVHSAGQPEMTEILGSFCEAVDKKHDKYMLSEVNLMENVTLNIASLQGLYQACRAHPIHAPFNFNLMTLPWSAQSFRSFIDEYEASLGPEDWPNYVLGNHDKHRLVTRVGRDKARLLAVLQLTLRGLPIVYFGDELGLPDGKVLSSQVRDTIELRSPGNDLGRDKSRTPMPWDSSSDAGFTTGTPWLPIGPAAHKLNVELEDSQPDSSLNLYQHLIGLRNSSPALIEGDYRSVELTDPNVYGYTRETELQRFLIILNFGAYETEVELAGSVGEWVAGTHEVEGDGQKPVGDVVKLAAYEGRIYEIRKGGIR
jgi:alpha-glucosidase